MEICTCKESCSKIDFDLEFQSQNFFFVFTLYSTRHEGRNVIVLLEKSFLIIEHRGRVLTATLWFWMRGCLYYVYISNNNNVNC